MFRTELHPEPSHWKINIKDRILSVGSCFAANTGQKLRDFKFDALINPFGIVYNPASVFDLLNRSLLKSDLAENLFLENQGVTRHYGMHSDVSADSVEALNALFIERRNTTHDYLVNGKVLIITLGTASVFRHMDLNAIVANCHKMPAHLFARDNLVVEEIYSRFSDLHSQLKSKNARLQVILTVSPVRHLRDSLPASQLSKSLLRVAVDMIVRHKPDVSYFPAYEIMMDDLRDYRFYASDMLHPSAVAIDYIWSKFKATYFDTDTLDFIDDWSKMLKNLHHRPFNSGTKEHQQFLVKTIDQLQRFNEVVDISDEKAILEQQLNGKK